MKIYTFLIAITLYSVNSNGAPNLFGGLKIPKENINSSTFISDDDVYDDSTGSESILLRKKDLVNYGLSYDLADDEEFVSLMLYIEVMDITKISKSLKSDLNANYSAKKDKYTNETRLYNTKEHWLLQDKKGNLIASCYIGSSIVNEEIKDADICNFISNIKGFGVEYSLTNENIGKYKYFEKYLADKIDSWKGVSKN
ncbi:MAG: hypothetical protein U5L02_18355 [Rheinheimera sp.]|nr:hypothetical protein [Rheinheimera sp.]